MTDLLVGPQDVEDYLEVASNGDSRAGVRLTLDVLDRGAPYENVIVDLLGAAQRESGQRWMHTDWSVADEHVVSGVTQKALDALASTMDEEATVGPVVVTCAEGDWHALAGQMFAEQLRGRGVDIVFLGASTPAAQVDEFLSRRGAEALAVSCNLPLFFRGVAALVDVAHAHRIPVLAGGRGLGIGAAWSRRLGVDSWAGGIDDAVRVLDSWRREPPVVRDVAVTLDPGAERLEADATTLAERAFAALELGFPRLATYDHTQRARTLEDLTYMVRFTAAARLVHDPAVLSEFVAWLLELLRHRGVPGQAVTAGLRALEPGVSQLDRGAGRVLLDTARAVG